MSEKKQKNWTTIGIIILILWTIIGSINTCNLIQEKARHQNNLSSLQSEVIKYQQKDSSHYAERQVLVLKNKELKNLVAGRDSLIDALKELVDDSPGTTSATIITTVTEASGEARIDTIYDTINNTYDRVIIWGDKWMKGRVSLIGERPTWEVSFNNQLEIWHENKKGMLTVKVKSLNPYTSVSDVRSYEIPKGEYAKPLSFWLGGDVMVSPGFWDIAPSAGIMYKNRHFFDVKYGPVNKVGIIGYKVRVW